MGAKNARRKRKCKSKVGFQNINEAKKAIVAMKKKAGVINPKFNSYICKDCGLYHIGHRAKKYSNL